MDQAAYPKSPYHAALLEDLKLQRSKLGLAGPIVTLSVGGGVGIFGLALAVGGSYGTAQCEGFHFDPDYSSSSDCDHEKAITIGAVMAVVGVITAAGGLAWLISRIGERRRLGREIKERSGYALSPQLELGHDRASAGVQLRF